MNKSSSLFFSLKNMKSCGKIVEYWKRIRLTRRGPKLLMPLYYIAQLERVWLSLSNSDMDCLVSILMI